MNTAKSNPDGQNHAMVDRVTDSCSSVDPIYLDATMNDSFEAIQMQGNDNSNLFLNRLSESLNKASRDSRENPAVLVQEDLSPGFYRLVWRPISSLSERKP